MMAAKEKARDLIEKFHQKMYHDLGAGAKHYTNKAPQCALVAVEEILDALGIFSNGPGWELGDTIDWQFWQAVKNEIEKWIK